jgi:hypothetical protein
MEKVQKPSNSKLERIWKEANMSLFVVAPEEFDWRD